MRTILESFVRNFKQHPLLGVDCVCFLCWDGEELVFNGEYMPDAKFFFVFFVFLPEHQMH
jgi:hypothetical protein